MALVIPVLLGGGVMGLRSYFAPILGDKPEPVAQLVNPAPPWNARIRSAESDHCRASRYRHDWTNCFRRSAAVSRLERFRLARVAVAAAGSAAAAGPDFSGITSAVDWGSVVTGIIAVAALAAAVYVAVRGAKMLLGMIRGA